jgi:hypothetical protein
MSLEEQASAQAGNAGASTDGAAQSGSAAPVVSDWTSGLSEDNRKTVEAKGWIGKGPDAILDGYRSLEGHLGKALVPPKDDAGPEDWSKFYGKLGRPEKPEAYELKRPAEIPENLPYDAKTAEEFKVWAHEAGLTPKQAAALHDKYMGKWANAYGSVEEQRAKAAAAAHEEIVKSWGDPDSATYKRNQELANRTVRNTGGQELLKELKDLGALGPNGEVMTPRLAAALAKVGQSLYAEDNLWSGGDTNRINPFSDKTKNETEQGNLIRRDPELAKALIRQAGIDPKDYGF